MIRTSLQSHWYCEMLPSGAFAALRHNGQYVATHFGQFQTPNGRGPLHLRVWEDNQVFKVAGQAWEIEATHELIIQRATGEFQWRTFPPGPWGISGAIYDRDGRLHVANQSVGSQGWRYVDATGQLVTGDSTYSSPFGLSEWTDIGYGLMIGQHNDDNNPGVVIYDRTNGKTRMLESGQPRFIRANRDGMNVAVAWWNQAHIPEVVMVRATIEELLGLSEVGKLPLPPPPPTPIPPIPIPIHPSYLTLPKSTIYR